MAESQTYTFQGRTFTEAFQKVKKKLGKDAYILEKRTAPRRSAGMLGGFLGGDEMVEIIAAATPPETPAPPRPKTTLLEKAYSKHEPVDGVTPGAVMPIPAAPEAGASAEARPGMATQRALSDALAQQREAFQRMRDEMMGEMSEMRRYLSLQARGGLPAVCDGLQQVYGRLVEAEVFPDIAAACVEHLAREAAAGALEDPVALDAAVARELADRMPAGGGIALRPGMQTVVALVGPTGVGKTTTIAKLAFEFVYKHGKRVAILNEDGRRCAEEQLRYVTSALGVPVARAETPERAAEELALLESADLVLVDTVGRVPGDTKAMDALAAYVRSVGAHETHLVLSSGASRGNLQHALASFRPAGVDRLIVSKLDESRAHGALAGLAAQTEQGVAYVTTGQEYMDTVVEGDSLALARLVLGMETPRSLGRAVAGGDAAGGLET